MKRRAYVNHGARMTAVFHRSLGCWVFRKHRRDGKVSRRTRYLYGWTATFSNAVTEARATLDAWQPPASGWTKAALGAGSERAIFWDDLHEEALR